MKGILLPLFFYFLLPISSWTSLRISETISPSSPHSPPVTTPVCPNTSQIFSQPIIFGELSTLSVYTPLPPILWQISTPAEPKAQSNEGSACRTLRALTVSLAPTTFLSLVFLLPDGVAYHLLCGFLCFYPGLPVGIPGVSSLFTLPSVIVSRSFGWWCLTWSPHPSSVPRPQAHIYLLASLLGSTQAPPTQHTQGNSASSCTFSKAPLLCQYLHLPHQPNQKTGIIQEPPTMAQLSHYNLLTSKWYPFNLSTGHHSQNQNWHHSVWINLQKL